MSKIKLLLGLFIVFYSCESSNNSSFDRSIDNLKKQKENDFVIREKGNTISFSNKYGLNTWTSIGKTGIDRLITPSVFIMNDGSVTFHFIFKFDSKIPVDPHGNAIISDKLNNNVEVVLDRVNDNEFIGFMGFISNEQDILKIKNIINSSEPTVSMYSGSDRLWFGLNDNDKSMLMSTIELYYQIKNLADSK